MSAPQFYRYFVACRPAAPTRAMLAQAGQKAGQGLWAVDYHLTFCVIAEVPERDPAIIVRAQLALAGGDFCSAPVSFGRVVSGDLGAMVKVAGRQDELQDLYHAIERRLRLFDLEPKHRKSGFHPHFTLGYEPCGFVPFILNHEWIPDELLLIESEVGLTRHNVLSRVRLDLPRQLILPFDDPSPSPNGSATAAADPARRSAA